jgi:SpoVK/Ycf46/Vps4 family AAA+-type ATPase
MISVGELGTDAVTVETKLTEVLETAQKWNAVLLLDECDIFLEKRNAEDMERNAVVSVFLRCVEYYQGILFLTTNRVKDLDPAFFSRISLPIHYDALTATGRESIWYSHLVGHGVKSDLAEELAGFMRISDLNGRQIKNCVRLAVATAETQHRTVTSKDLTMVTNYLEDFIECSKEEVTEA